MKVVAFLPVKEKSERLPNKNTKILFGKPLYLHTLEKLLSCEFIDEVYLDSEDDKILNAYDYLPYKKFKRDPSLATNKTDGNSLFYNECRNIDADIYIQISATAPFLSVETIKKSVDILVEDSNFDSVVCARKEKIYTWSDGKPNYDLCKIPNSNQLEEFVAENMSLNSIRRSSIIELKRRIGNNPKLIFVDKIESIDIDYQEDFFIAESIFLQRAIKEKLYFDKIKQIITSELLSDILDESQIKNRVFHLKTNLPQYKIMARAKTIRLKKIENENYERIYDATKYYEYINFNNILCVENEAKDYAYFGEINALMSISKGCQATIIDGTTRDIKEVTSMGYPVYYEKNMCQDLNRKAVLDYYDKPIFIKGIKVCPDDLIFADHEGIVVIPKKEEKKILDKAIENYMTEKKIILDLALGKSITNYRF